jgi:hypothetical protein
VIVIDRGSYREVIADGTTGFLLNDVAEAVQALERTSEIIPAACCEHVEQHFSLEQMVAEKWSPKNGRRIRGSLRANTGGQFNTGRSIVGMALPHQSRASRILV